MGMKIGIDGMGGDNAPVCTLIGSELALQSEPELEIYFYGISSELPEELLTKLSGNPRFHLVPVTEKIGMEEVPTLAIQGKPDSSLVRGLRDLHDGEIDSFVSAGSTGAVLVGGQVLSGKLKGVRRAPLAVLLPTLKGRSLLIDCGANIDPKPEYLLHFALMGSVYMREICGIENPTVGLLNIGTEEEKGNSLTKAAYPLLSGNPEVHFTGNFEAREVPFGGPDVIVTDAFSGNLVLKMYEGVSKALLSEIKTSLKSTTRGKIGGLFVKPSLKGLIKKFDSSTDGGALVLGLRGLLLKAHGNSTEIQIKNAIMQCIEFRKHDMNEKIEKALEA